MAGKSKIHIRRPGYTLVELVVLIAIIAILAAMRRPGQTGVDAT